jgi:predicted nucleic acid-binding protein
VRAVLDTNVLVSAFVFPGAPPEAVYRRVLSGEVTLIVSRPLLAELGRVLIEKFDREPAYAEEVLAQLVRIGELVEWVSRSKTSPTIPPTTVCSRRPPKAGRS